MTPPKPRLRDDLVDLAPYASPQRPARFQMNTNESPYGPPGTVMDAIDAAMRARSLNRYPEHSAEGLYRALSAHVGVDEDRLWVGNGSNEVLLHLFLAYGGPSRKLLAFEPTYSMHTKIARIAGATVVHEDRSADWTVGPDAVEEAIEKHEPDICIFCSPNNPTGALERPEAIEVAARRVPLVIVDEAYIEFSSRSGIGVEGRDGLVVVRTLSKAWRLAGGRIGYAICPAGMREELAKVALPYGLSTLTQAIGTAALEAGAGSLGHVSEIVGERDRIYAGMEALGLQPWPSDANFILVPFPTRSEPSAEEAARVWKGLLDREVLVRDYGTEGALAGHLRVTAGTPEETEAFLNALKEVLDG